MDIKLFEIRDRMTFMPMMAIRLSTTNDTENYLLRRAGFDTRKNKSYIQLINLVSSETRFLPNNWDGIARTIPVAHKYIAENFDELETGDVIDVEFILGETTKKKVSERVTMAREIELATRYFESLEMEERND